MSQPTFHRLPVVWSRDDLTLRQLIAKPALSLPIIIRITGGVEGGDEFHSFSTGEIFWVYGIARQRRYVASCSNKLYSIPGEYSIKFHLENNGRKSIPGTLQQVVEEAKRSPDVWGSTPRVRLAENDIMTEFIAEDVSKSRHIFDMFVIDDEYDEEYLQAHAIDTSQYETPKVVFSETLLPVYLPLTVDVAVCLQRTAVNFNDWMSSLADKVARYKFEPAVPCQDIILIRSRQRRPAVTQDSQDILYEPIATVRRATTDDYINDLIKAPPLLSSPHRYGQRQPLPVDLSGTPKAVVPKFSSKTLPRSFLANQISAGHLKTTSSTSSEFPDLRRVPDYNTTATKAGVDTPPPPPPPRRPVSVGYQMLSDTRGKDKPLPAEPDRALCEPRSAAQNITWNARPFSDVPPDISSLSTAEVADCLMQLKLAEYVDIFRVNDVDGRLLKTLDEQILVEDFKMSKIEARRLTMFASQGWRPNRQ